MTHRNARLTPVTRAELVEQVKDSWHQTEVARCSASPALPPASGCSGSVKVERTCSMIAPVAPYAAPSGRSVPGSSYLYCTPHSGLETASHRVELGIPPVSCLRRGLAQRTKRERCCFLARALDHFERQGSRSSAS